YYNKISEDDNEVEGNTTLLVVANGPFIGGSRIPLTDLSPHGGYLNTFIFTEDRTSVLNDIFKQRDSMNWNKMTDGIKHLLAKKITIDTEPQMKVDIDGEISLKTPLQIEVVPNAIQILTLPEEKQVDETAEE